MVLRVQERRQFKKINKYAHLEQNQKRFPLKMPIAAAQLTLQKVRTG